MIDWRFWAGVICLALSIVLALGDKAKNLFSWILKVVLAAWVLWIIENDFGKIGAAVIIGAGIIALTIWRKKDA